MIKSVNLENLNIDLYDSFYNKSIYSTPFHNLDFLVSISCIRKDLKLFFNIIYSNKKIIAIMPYFKIKKIPFSMVALPYGCYGGYLYHNKQEFLNYIQHTNPLKYISTLISYNDDAYKKLNLESTTYSTWILDINMSYDTLFSTLPSKTRNQIRKSFKSNVYVMGISTVNELKQVKVIYRELLLKHDIEAPYDDKLFDNLYKFSKKSKDIIFKVAKFENKVISYSVFLKNHNSIFYWLNASLSSCLKLNGTNAILNDILKYACDTTCVEFNMGAVPNGNSGLMHFKSRWNAKEKLYQNYTSKLYKLIRKLK